MKTVKDLKFTFNPTITVKEAVEDNEGNWLRLGGIALTEGVSRNMRSYSFENLKENDGKEFKWLFGHPEEAEGHVVGLGKLHMEEGVLRHEGKIRNTSLHPDVVESVKDGFLGPSIHASIKEATFDKDKKAYNLKGLEIEGVGLVAFQGVKNASIDYAIAESFKERTELKESSSEDDKNKDMEGINMPEEIKKVKEEEQEEESSEEEPEAPKEEESVSVEDFKAVEKELKALKEERKEKIVDSILEMNKDLKKEELMKESEDKLKVVLEYEKKLSSKTEEAGVVEESEADNSNEVAESKDQRVAMLSQEAYDKFNKDLAERVR